MITQTSKQEDNHYGKHSHRSLLCKLCFIALAQQTWCVAVSCSRFEKQKSNTYVQSVVELSSGVSMQNSAHGKV